GTPRRGPARPRAGQGGPAAPPPRPGPRRPRRRPPPSPGHDREGRRGRPGRPCLPHRGTGTEPGVLAAGRPRGTGRARGTGGGTVNLLRRPAAGAAVLTAACALVLAPATTASAHPLGNFTVNRYDGLVAAPGELRVRHVEDLAEIPATQAGPDIDRLGRDRWARERCAAAARDSEVRVGGRAAPLTVRDARARVRP